jgi:alginate O-acetyltransferase complex protein AlgI
MLFQSQIFIVFVLIFIILYWAIHKKIYKNIILLASSLIFYAFWNIPYILILVFSIIFNFYLGHYLSNNKSKIILLIGCFVNLSILGFFKYLNFGIDTINQLLDYNNSTFYIVDLSIILPIGISFYTFQNISYIVDMYYKRYKPYNSKIDFSVYISFFPQLIAGPIVRGDYFQKQINRVINFNWKLISTGCSIFIIGVFKKVVLADQASIFANAAFNVENEFSSFLTLIGIFAFSFQIYFDFSGYTDMARGIAYCFGIKLPINFLNPYNAVGFSDFWRRWHITLSNWLRDYLFIPLGGSKVVKFKIYRNLIITMFLGGLWHGAGWNFIIWGLIHGIFLSIELLLFKETLKKLHSPLFKFLITLLTYLCVCFAWIFFRAEDFTSAIIVIKNIFLYHEDISYFHQGALFKFQNWLLGFILPSCILLFSYFKIFDKTFKNYNPIFSILFLLGLVCLIIISTRGSSEFIYFQF